ncbi:hypothetical protein Z046_31405 [Pseudomonas aeruginosa VRFPA09]|nr:hypothetical protein Z046_31405 [Pseudomonas aeruginosa VRFPA09]
MCPRLSRMHFAHLLGRAQIVAISLLHYVY